MHRRDVQTQVPFPPMTLATRIHSDGSTRVIGITKGDVYKILVPSAHCRGSEQHHEVSTPWLVVSTDEIHRNLPIVVAVPLTSQLQKADTFRKARISLEKSSWVKGREMSDPSLALTEQVRVIAHDRIKDGPIARLTPASRSAVEAGLAYVLGIP